MNPQADLTASFRGWSEILAGKPGAREHFRTDAGGVVIASITLLIAILLSVAAQSAVVGIPTLAQLVFGLGYLIYRAARQLAAMTLGVSIAFAGLCVIVLVVVPNALYMLLSLLPSA